METIVNHLREVGQLERGAEVSNTSKEEKRSYLELKSSEEVKNAFKNDKKFSSHSLKIDEGREMRVKEIMRLWPTHNDLGETPHTDFRKNAPLMLKNEKFCRSLSPMLKEDIRSFMESAPKPPQISLREVKEELIVPIVLSTYEKVFGVYKKETSKEEYKQRFNWIKQIMDSLNHSASKEVWEKAEEGCMASLRWMEEIVRERLHSSQKKPSFYGIEPFLEMLVSNEAYKGDVDTITNMFLFLYVAGSFSQATFF